MRIVAFIVVAVFLPEQVAQAIEYDWRVLWQKPTLNTFTPPYLKDTRAIDIPLAIKTSLKTFPETHQCHQSLTHFNCRIG